MFFIKINIFKMGGLKNINVKKLMHMFDMKRLDIIPDPAMNHDDCSVSLRKHSTLWNGSQPCAPTYQIKANNWSEKTVVRSVFLEFS